MEITEYRPGEMKLLAGTRYPKILVLSEAYYPGWKAFVDLKE